MLPGLLETPSLSEPKHPLRGYQKDAIDAVRAEFARGIRRTLMVLATGLGKSLCAGYICRGAIEKGKRVLLLAHTRDLVNQLANTMDDCGIQPAVEMADQYARTLFDPQCVVGSVMTMQGERLATWDPGFFDLLIVDEAHHASYESESYQAILRHFHRARVLGLTATPMRHDGSELGKVFQSDAFKMEIKDGWLHPDGPFLSTPDVRRCPVNIDLKGMKKKRSDFDESQLDARIAPAASILANVVYKEARDVKCLHFTPGIRSSQGLATAIRSLAEKVGWDEGRTAEWVSGIDPRREEKIAAYRRGEIRHLVCCHIGTEGFDDPLTECIGMFRPTDSLTLLIQMFGRGTRRIPGKKETFRVLDIEWMVGDELFRSTPAIVDALNLDEEVREITLDMFKANKSLDLVEAVKRAERVKGDVVEREILRVNANPQQLNYRRLTYDPMEYCKSVGLSTRNWKRDAVVTRATEGQARTLRKFGIEDASNLSKTRASTIIAYEISRRKAKMSTSKQMPHLLKAGMDAKVAREMTSQQASEFLDRLWGKKRTG